MLTAPVAALALILAGPTAATPLRHANTFLDRLEAMGIELPYRPQVRDWTRPSLISWRETARAVAVPTWSEVPEKMRGLFEVMAPPGRAKLLFDEAFRWFFVPHELAHFLQSEFGRTRGHSRRERLASDVAVAWWRTQPHGADRLRQFSRLVDHAIAALPDPTPLGHRPDTWFDGDYDTFARAPRRGAAYQFRFVRDSIRQEPGPVFDALVRGILAQQPVPTAVQRAPELDVGFHVAAHLELKGVALTLHDPKYVERVRASRDPADIRLADAAPRLSAALTTHWKVHRILRVPAVFPNFADTRVALRVLTRQEPRSPANQRVTERLDQALLPLYPFLGAFEGEPLALARELAALMEHEYAIVKRLHTENHDAWERARQRFRDAWYLQMAPALRALDPDRDIRQVVAVLSPALRRHGKSFRVREGIGRFAALLPENEADLERSLMYALHEMCHGISDDLVYDVGHDRGGVSYAAKKKGAALHALIEAAADQAMFEGLGRTSPALQEKFLKGFGSRRWLAERGLLAKRIAFAGHPMKDGEVAALEAALLSAPVSASRTLYTRGLLVPKRTAEALRARVLRGSPGRPPPL